MKKRTAEREYQRKSVKDFSYALLSGAEGTLGQIRDMSAGGLAFEYLPLEGPEDAFADDRCRSVDIMVSGSSFYLSRIPCRVVYDIPLDRRGEGLFLPVESRRCGLCFGALSPEMKESIEFFLDRHAVNGSV